MGNVLSLKLKDGDGDNNTGTNVISFIVDVLDTGFMVTLIDNEENESKHAFLDRPSMIRFLDDILRA